MGGRVFARRLTPNCLFRPLKSHPVFGMVERVHKFSNEGQEDLLYLSPDASRHASGRVKKEASLQFNIFFLSSCLRSLRNELDVAFDVVSG